MIAVDMTNPPAYVVLVGHEPGKTWPFPDGVSAAAFYQMAVESGQFEHSVKPATKKRPALIVSLVSLWKRETVQTVSGQDTIIYVTIEESGAKV